MSLTKKLVLTFLLVTLIPIGVIIWVSRQTLGEQAQQQIGTRFEDSVVQVGKSMDEFMFNSFRNIQTLAADPDMSSGNLEIANRRLARLAGLIFLLRSSHAGKPSGRDYCLFR